MCARLRLRRHLIQARHESEEPGATTWKADDDQKTKSMMMREVTRHYRVVRLGNFCSEKADPLREKEKSEAAWRGGDGDTLERNSQGEKSQGENRKD